MQIPSNLFLNKIGKPSIYLPISMVLWGVVSATTGIVQSYTGLMIVRFLLGFVEAAYFPGCLFFLSSWYTRKELGFRTAMLYSGSLISGAFSGLITAAITRNLDGILGFRAWRWLFFIEGSITITVAILAVFILPDFPRTTSWLNDRDRELASWRLEEDIGEEDSNESKHESYIDGFMLALADVKVWIMVSCPTFFDTIPKRLNISDVHAVLLCLRFCRQQLFSIGRPNSGLR